MTEREILWTIAHTRRAWDISQSDVARRTGLTRQKVSNAINGYGNAKRRLNIERLVTILDAYGYELVIQRKDGTDSFKVENG